MTALTDKSFAAFTSANKFALIHFWAEWNRYDDELKATLEGGVPSQVPIGTLDTDPLEHHDLCRSHQVRNLPFLALYRDGVLVTTVTGLLAGKEFVRQLSKHVT